jgi:hypothetical protein
MLTSITASIALALGQVPAPPSAVSQVGTAQPSVQAGSIQTGSVEVLPIRPVSRSGVAVVGAAGAAAGEAAKDTNPPVKDAPPVIDTALSGSGNGNDQARLGFVRGVLKAYKEAFNPPPPSGDEQEPKRRALPAPWSSPPFPGHEYQGYPLIGVPPEPISNPLMMGLYNTAVVGDFLKEHKIQVYGWVTSEYNWSQARNSNSPTSYWIVPNRFEVDQTVLRFERQLDSVQQDHIDWGGRATAVYGMDYRYLTAGGWFSDQLLRHNRLYGFDPTELYADVYFPGITQGMIVRVGRWIACPDIETQFAPDNYLGSHSILFTFDTYTQTGIMLTFLINEQWIWQIGLNAGNDMAPWYRGAEPSLFLGLRWVSKDNNDAVYFCVNQLNKADFHHFEQDGQPTGHDNFNYVVGTWEHRFTEKAHTKTEAYFMWQRDAEVGGTPSIGDTQFFGGGGGDGQLLPGLSYAYGVLNYSMWAFSKKDYLTLRNEWWRDDRGMRSGFAGNYTSHTIGWSHTFNSVLQFRPEIGYYRNWTQPAFDLGTKNGIWIAGFDFTVRF